MSKVPPVSENEKVQKYKAGLLKKVKKGLKATKKFVVNQIKSDKDQDTA